jgi:NADPH-dependent 2,4-dienoyl-CoA reductase/sulfur reductase-like enzyme
MSTHHTTYLIIGGGLAADAAIRTLLKKNPDAGITLISGDSTLPYDRPALSKDLITDTETTVKEIIHDTEPYEDNVRTFLGRKAVVLDVENHVVRDSEGEHHSYEKLLLATGGRPKTLPGSSDHILYYRTLSDFKTLEKQIALGHRIAVIGDGFIGTEIAASLTDTECDTFLIHPHSHIGANRFPESLCLYLDEKYRDHGVDVLPNQHASAVEPAGDTLVVTTKEGGRYAADSVVAGLGIVPNIELAEEAGLDVEDGIRVNAHLQSSHPDIYAAGDAASIYRKETDQYCRVEHEMNALKTGAAAGRSMAGDPDVNFTYTPLFYSDVFDDGFEAVGDLDADLTMVEDWQDDLKKGVVYYLDNGNHLRGVLLWNLFGKTDQARDLMNQGPVDNPDSLLGRIAA